MRVLVEGLCRLMQRVYFRHVDELGAENVPREGPLLIVGNHPNGLMDPLLMLSLSPRPVSFMAKEPLFRTPLIGLFVKGLDCLPVYRTKDGADPGHNRKTMEAARALLSRGGTIAIFPEGVSHDEPRLQQLKTGAARMALATQRLISDGGEGTPLRIQPVGLYFENKSIFRSEAVMVWGTPMEVPVVEIDDTAEPDRENTLALTEAISQRLRALTPEGPNAHLVALAARTARLLAAIRAEENEHSSLPSIGDRLSIMQRLLVGHGEAETQAPERLHNIVERIERHERDLSYWGLTPDHTTGLPERSSVKALWRTLAIMLMLAPLALLGLVVNYPAYRLIGTLANRYAAGHDDVVSTLKTAAGLVLVPLGWIAFAGIVGIQTSALGALLALLLSPLCAWAALHFAEHLDALGSAARSIRLMLMRQDRHAALLADRKAIRDELLSIESTL